MSQIDDLREEYESCYLDMRRARLEVLSAFRPPRFTNWYRFTHDPLTGKSNGVVFLVIFAAVVLGVAMTTHALAPNLYYSVGSDRFELNATDLYECSECHLSTTTADMATYDGYYYYCPQCGHVMGNLNPGQKHGPN
jgi:hypothetical protein